MQDFPSDSYFEVYDSIGNLVAVVAKHAFNKQGVNFLSDSTFPLQLGISLYKKGHLIEPHEHRQRSILISTVQEVIHIDRGRINVHLFDCEGRHLKSIELGSGDTIHLINGGHGFDILEETKLIEVKQGPYLDKESDKRMIKK